VETLSKLTRKLENYAFTGDLYSLETLMDKIIKALPRDQRHSIEFRKTILEWKNLLPPHETQRMQLIDSFYKTFKPKILHCCKAILRKDKIISGDSTKRRSSNALGIVFTKETKLNKRKYDPWRDG
jgi:hypothetical protein